MKTKQQLINNIIGQLQGINKMMTSNKDCFAVLVQMKAARAGLDKVINDYLSEEMLKCLSKCKKGDKKCAKILKELIKN